MLDLDSKFCVDFYNPLNLFPSKETFISRLVNIRIRLICFLNLSCLDLVFLYLHVLPSEGKKKFQFIPITEGFEGDLKKLLVHLYNQKKSDYISSVLQLFVNKFGHKTESRTILLNSFTKERKYAIFTQIRRVTWTRKEKTTPKT